MCRAVCCIVLTIGMAVATLPDASGGHLAKLEPINIAGVNTPKDEDDPCVSAKGLSLLYATNAGGRYQIHLSRRPSAAAAWPAGKPIEGLEGEGDSRSPCLSADDHDLY